MWGISLSASLIFFSKYDLSVSYLVFKTNRLVSILFTSATNLSYTVFLTTLLFTTLISLLKSTGSVFNLPSSVLSISARNWVKFDFSARLDVSTLVAFFQICFCYIIRQMNFDTDKSECFLQKVHMF